MKEDGRCPVMVQFPAGTFSKPKPNRAQLCSLGLPRCEGARRSQTERNYARLDCRGAKEQDEAKPSAIMLAWITEVRMSKTKPNLVQHKNDYSGILMGIRSCYEEKPNGK